MYEGEPRGRAQSARRSPRVTSASSSKGNQLARSNTGHESILSTKSDTGDAHLRSMLGTQPESRKESAPAFGFGTSNRATLQVLYGGKRLDKNRVCRLSPGPVYLPGGRGSQTKAPTFKFGTAAGAGAAGYGPAQQGAAPGPGEYEKQDSLGMQAPSCSKTAPAYGWGTSPAAIATPSAAGIHGRGKTDAIYELRESIGPQASSTKNNSYSFGFGTAQRFSITRSALRKAAAAPGPGAYNLREAGGSQYESTKKTQPSFGFGTAERFGVSRPAGMRGTPGPMYTMHNSVGMQVISERTSKPSYGFGSQRRFGDAGLRPIESPGPGAYNA